jgi:Uncharacterized conserved protein
MNIQQKWIEYLQLAFHPEGGYFREIYRNNQEYIDDQRYSGKRNLATSIYYMLQSGQVSKLHRLNSDEIWYFHYGSPICVHVFYHGNYQQQVLGTDLINNHQLQIILPAGSVFGAEVLLPDSFSIVGCMVSPGFHFEDFKLIKGEELLPNFPALESVIKRLT